MNNEKCGLKFWQGACYSDPWTISEKGVYNPDMPPPLLKMLLPNLKVSPKSKTMIPCNVYLKLEPMCLSGAIRIFPASPVDLDFCLLQYAD